MLNQFLKYADLPARAGLSAIFVVSGVGKIGAYVPTQAYMEAFGLPGILLAPTIAFEIGAGISLLLGWSTRSIAFLLAGFSLVTAVVFHRDFADQIQQIMFLKNVAMAGGLLWMAKTGAPGLSLDSLRASAAKT